MSHWPNLDSRPLQLQGRLEASHSSSVYSGGKVFGNGQRLIQLSVSFSLSQFRLTLLVSVQLSLLLGRLPWSLTFLALVKCFIIILISYVFPSLELVCGTSLWDRCEVKSFKKTNMKLYANMIKYICIQFHPKPPHLSQYFFCFIIKSMCHHKANTASCRGARNISSLWMNFQECVGKVVTDLFPLNTCQFKLSMPSLLIYCYLEALKPTPPTFSDNLVQQVRPWSLNPECQGSNPDWIYQLHIWHGASHSTSLGLSFFICKMEIIVDLAARMAVKIKWTNPENPAYKGPEATGADLIPSEMCFHLLLPLAPSPLSLFKLSQMPNPITAEISDYYISSENLQSGGGAQAAK